MQRATDPLLTAAVCAYFAAVMLASSVPGLSRLVHVCVLLLGLALVHRTWRSGLVLRSDPAPVGFLLFFGMAFGSVLWAAVPGPALVTAIGLGVDVFGAVLVLIALWNGASLPALGVVALATGAIQALVGISQFGDVENLRVGGLAGNANSLAIRLSLATFIGLLALPKRVWPRFAGLALIVTATILSGSRKVVFVWLAYCLYLLRLLGGTMRRSSLYAGLLLLVVPVLVLVVMNNPDPVFDPIRQLHVYERIEATLEGEESSANLREQMIREGWLVWRASPFWGHGIDQFRHVNRFFRSYSHNNYVELLANLGLFGFLLYYGTIFLLAARGLKAVFLGEPLASVPLLALLLLLLWDVALVSYTNRLVWVALAVIADRTFVYLVRAEAEEAPPPPSPGTQGRLHHAS